MKEKKLKPYRIRRRSDGAVVCNVVHAYSKKQAVGFYVTHLLRKPWLKRHFYANRLVKKMDYLVRQDSPSVDCSCGYKDPQAEWASNCPNCS